MMVMRNNTRAFCTVGPYLFFLVILVAQFFIARPFVMAKLWGRSPQCQKLFINLKEFRRLTALLDVVPTNFGSSTLDCNCMEIEGFMVVYNRHRT
jgi:hypothetical protein